MANWCFSKYYIRSCDDSAEQLYDRMKRLQEMKEPLKPNGFGTTWLGNLVEDLGVDFNKVQCRGSWDELTFDNGILSFTTETAWYRCTEVEDLISEKYPNIEIAFLCEEPGMGIYEKNSNEFFTEDYLIETDDGDSQYCSEEEALEFISDHFGVDFLTINDGLQAVREYNEDSDIPEIKVYRFDFIS